MLKKKIMWDFKYIFFSENENKVENQVKLNKIRIRQRKLRGKNKIL